MRNLLFLSFILFFTVSLFLSCANTKPPTGGPRDTLAPVLIYADPEMGELNFKGNEIELEFDEFVEAPQLFNKLIITPTIKSKFKSSVNRRSVIIRFNEDEPFEENTTYTLNFQKMGETEKYITGNYDLEIPTLPPLLVNDVEVKQSHTTTVEVPRPAIVTLLMVSPGYGSLYVHEGNNLKWIYNLPTDSKRESLRLQPGKYTVVFRSMNAKQSIYTISRTFEVNSGMSIPVELY